MILKRWLFFLRIPLVLAAAGLFFSFYNHFLIDANLKNLKTSLSVLDAATGVGQAEAALLLVDQTLVSAMAQEELDLKTVATLQYAQGTLNGGRERPVVDAQVMVNTLAEDKKAHRVGGLGVLDALASGAQRMFADAVMIPRRIGKKPLSEEIDQARLDEAARMERQAHLQEAAVIYEQLIQSYPHYVGRSSLKLRLGYIDQRLQEWKQAQRLYQEAMQETREVKEMDAARQLLSGLALAQTQLRKAQALERKVESLGSGPERQKMEFELATLWLQLYAMGKAAEAFQLAVAADPDGPLAEQSLFKRAWCLRMMGRFQEAVQEFRAMVRQNSKGSLAAASLQQIAEIHKATGDFAQALKIYEEIIAETEDPTLRSLVLAQAGSMALYDLRDSEKARAYFQKLASEFPASQMSTIEHDISRLESEKAGLVVRQGSPSPRGSPIFGWAQRTLPTFVQTFADRLARYMESLGETKVTRKYTAEEFRNIVLRRVQELFPGQILNVEIAIRPDGYTGSCTVRIGPLSFPVAGKVWVFVANKKPHLAVREMRLFGIPVPAALFGQLDTQVNQTIDQLQLPLEVTEYMFGDGFVIITAERVK